MLFLYGFLTAAGIYLFCRFVAFMAPLGEPETGAGRRERKQPFRYTLPGFANTVQPGLPPPPPPCHTYSEWRGAETPESVRDTQDYETYMAGFNHGLVAHNSDCTDTSRLSGGKE